MCRAVAFTAIGILCLGLSGCKGDGQAVEMPTGPGIALAPVSYDVLPGWQQDRLSQALPPLQKSCTRILSRDPKAELGAFAGKAEDWQSLCAELSLLLLATDDEARAYFEKNFQAYAVTDPQVEEGNPAQGLFTGYYEPLLRGSFEKKEPFLYPLYPRPDDLVTVDLGAFRDDLKGENIVGRVSDTKSLVPYFKRADIEGGAIDGKTLPVVYVDDAVDAFFLHIQGSGQVVMEDGRVLRVGYANQNGHPYFAIGKDLIARGALTKDAVSMQSIRAWLEANPQEAADVMNLNASYIFFKLNEDTDGPLGAQGLPLTPLRSLAVDRKKYAYGVPVFVDTVEQDGNIFQHLMIAQDTGGAIRGAVRGDIFFGAGKEAEARAGVMKGVGRAFVLLPRSVQVGPEYTPPVRKWRLKGLFSFNE